MVAGAWQRARGQMWPLVQQAVACGLSWWVARILFDHHVPLFAPVSTLVALNSPLGGRGSNAVRVVIGVVCGVLIGQAAYEVLGHTAGSLAVGCAVWAALLVALVLDGERVTMAQAGVSAVIAVASGRLAGIDRILDVLVGVAVALVFSQLFFPVHPLKLLRRAEAAALEGVARILLLATRTHGSDPGQLLPLETRSLYQLLHDVDQARTDMVSVARRTPRWRLRRGVVQEMSDAALRLGMLGNSCLTLARLTADASADTVRPSGAGPRPDASAKALADALETYAASPPDVAARRRCVRTALAVAARVPPAEETGPEAEAVRLAVELTVRDLLVVVGVAAADADRAVRERAPDAPLTTAHV
ncbi:FUSC family protein [Streptomyces sp. NPDC006367]|uniref:FUSC family protein n=1 Tax=unclassified Streptomyces TaxID=2593676 RepID=UPI0033AC766F